MLDQGSKEYPKGVLGLGLSKTNPPAKAVGNKPLLLDKLPGPIVRFL